VGVIGGIIAWRWSFEAVRCYSELWCYVESVPWNADLCFWIKSVC
jgi:hypothetical protein